jgi:hypothetical protein
MRRLFDRSGSAVTSRAGCRAGFTAPRRRLRCRADRNAYGHIRLLSEQTPPCIPSLSCPLPGLWRQTGTPCHPAQTGDGQRRPPVTQPWRRLQGHQCAQTPVHISETNRRIQGNTRLVQSAWAAGSALDGAREDPSAEPPADAPGRGDLCRACQASSRDGSLCFNQAGSVCQQSTGTRCFRYHSRALMRPARSRAVRQSQRAVDGGSAVPRSGHSPAQIKSCDRQHGVGTHGGCLMQNRDG